MAQAILFFSFSQLPRKAGDGEKREEKNAQDKAFGEYFVSSSPFFPFFNQRRCRLEGCRPSKQGFRGSPNRARVLFLFRYSDAGELDANKRKSWRWRVYAKLALWRKIENVAASYWLHYTETNVRALSWLKSVLRLVCESVSVACLSFFIIAGSKLCYRHGIQLAMALSKPRGWRWRNWQLGVETHALAIWRSVYAADAMNDVCVGKSTDDN